MNVAIEAIETYIKDPFSDVKTLDSREREALRLVSRGIPMTEVGENFGLTRSAAYLITSQALKKVHGETGIEYTYKELPNRLISLIETAITVEKEIT